jgi:small subunit ribosomal protein S9
MNKKTVKENKITGKYVEGIGRRKTAVARVRIGQGNGNITINDKNYNDYFSLPALQKKVLAPISELKLTEKFSVSAKVEGGGINAQAEAIRHGLARALTVMNPSFKKRLAVVGYVTRDSRMVERKKYGLKKARRAPQWQKR